jgi:predicted small secreted protein
MKAKQLIATTGAAIIAGSLFYYYLSRRSAAKTQIAKPAKQANTGEDKIRRVMHHAKENHGRF